MEDNHVNGPLGIAVRSFVNWGFRKKFDLHLVRLPGHGAYSNVHLANVYAPWNIDPQFLRAYESIRENTMMNVHRLWQLWQLVGQTVKLDSGGILEVGVWRGGSGALMAKRANLEGSNEPVYLCDTFEGVVKAGTRDNTYRGGEHADTSPAIVETLIRDTGVRNVHVLKGIFPEQTSDLVEPGARFRLCHIDVDVYESSRDVTEWAWSRLVRGGILVYDDYGETICRGVTQYIEEQALMPDRLVMGSINGQATVIKL